MKVGDHSKGLVKVYRDGTGKINFSATKHFVILLFQDPKKSGNPVVLFDKKSHDPVVFGW